MPEVDELTFEDLNQLDLLYTLVQQRCIPQISGNNTAILVVGNTGAGKSSTIDMLIDENETCRPVIGRRAGRSQTIYPEFFVDKENSDLVYCDTSGFEDPRSDRKPALSLLMQSVVHHNQIKGILIMIDTRSFSDKAMALLKLLNTINHLIKDGVKIEQSCIFGITHVAAEPALDTPPDSESIYSLESLNAVLEDLRQGFEEDLDEEIVKIKMHAQQHNGTEFGLNKYAQELIAKTSVTIMLQKAIQAERVVLVHNKPDKKVQSCANLRRQFQLLSNGHSINDSLNFENYDSDRMKFMDKIVRQSTHLLETLEYEYALIKQHNYLLQSYSQENGEQRIAEIQHEITQKEHEKANIDIRDTASEPHWVESKKLGFAYEPGRLPGESGEPPERFPECRGRASFTYNKKEPIARIELIGKLQFSYLKTFWNVDAPLPVNVGNTLIVTPLRVAMAQFLGLSEIFLVGREAISNNYKFKYMRMGNTLTLIDAGYWEQNITLPDVIDPTHASFYVSYEGTHSVFMDCYYRTPTVKIYVPICYMTGNPERIESLNNLLIVLRQQIQEIEKVIERSNQALEQHDIKDDLSRDKKLLIEQVVSELNAYAEEIEQQRKLITLISDVFTKLRIPVHENIQKLMQFWNEREAKLHSIAPLQERSVEGISRNAVCATQKMLSTAFRNSIRTLFSQNQHFEMRQTEQGLDIQATRPDRGYHPVFFKSAKQKFEKLIRTNPEYSLTKTAENLWSVNGNAASIAQLHDDLLSISNETLLANDRIGCTIS